MNVLLTGGTGYIGSHTAIVLNEIGFNVILYDNLSNSRNSVLESLKSITGKIFPFIEGDVCDSKAVASVLEEYSIDAVIHFAGLKSVGESVEKPIEYYSNNLGGTVGLLKAMNISGVKSLIFSSSATVYGSPQYLPLDENHPTSATNPYGRSKLQIEEILADVSQSDPDWKIVCLRYFNPVGAHESALIGEDPNDIPNNLMPYIAQVASGRLPYLNVFGSGYDTKDGTGVRDYIHVMDLAEGHKKALLFLNDNIGWHAINLGTGVGYSVLEMVNVFQQISGKEIPYRVVARRAGDIATCYAKVEKAQNEIGWNATRSLQQMCVDAWRFQMKKDK